jgi:hypothetical protein
MLCSKKIILPWKFNVKLQKKIWEARAKGGGQKKFGGAPPLYYPYAHVWGLAKTVDTIFNKQFFYKKNKLLLLLFKKKFSSLKMGCPALGIWVAFLTQPDALPGRAPPKNKNYIFFNYFWFICDSLFMIFIFLNFFWRFFFVVLYQAVRAVSKNVPKYPMLDIPFT